MLNLKVETFAVYKLTGPTVKKGGNITVQYIPLDAQPLERSVQCLADRNTLQKCAETQQEEYHDRN